MAKSLENLRAIVSEHCLDFMLITREGPLVHYTSSDPTWALGAMARVDQAMRQRIAVETAKRLLEEGHGGS